MPQNSDLPWKPVKARKLLILGEESPDNQSMVQINFLDK
jgi:hypothetical protein